MNCHMKFKIIWACLGISAGILAGGTFAAEYKVRYFYVKLQYATHLITNTSKNVL